jgi:hypothetical protein
MKNYNNDFFFLTFSIVISFFLSSIYHYIPKIVGDGLVISGLIEYPEHPSLMKEVFSTSFTLLAFFSAAILKISNSIFLTSKIIIFLNTLLFTLGFLYLVFGITKSKLFSSFITVIILFLEIKSGSGDYPTLYFSEHINGSLSFSLFTFIIGSFIIKKLALSGFTLGLFFAIHPVTSAWLFLHLSILFVFFKIKKINVLNKSFFIGLSLGIGAFLLFFIFYKFITFQNSSFIWPLENKEFMNEFIKNFDWHRGLRNTYLNVNIFIFVTSIFLIILLNRIKLNKNLFFIFSLIIFLNFSGQITFFISRFYFDLFPMIVKNIMPTRFLTFCSPVLIPILISIIFKILNEKYFFENKFFLKHDYLLALILSIFLLIPFLKSERITSIKKNIISKRENYNLKKISYNDPFWENLRKINTVGHLISIGGESLNKNYIYYISFKPLLLDTTALNFLPYFPHLSGYYKEILENVYGLDIKKLKDKYKNTSNIPIEISINHFKNLDAKQWNTIKTKYNVSGLVLDKNIELKIKPYLIGKNLNFYLFE